MAFGLPNAADLNGIVTNLGTIAASLGPEATAAIQPIIEQIAGHADALEDKAIAAESTDEDKLLARLDRAIAILTKFEGYSNGFTVEVTPKLGPTPVSS